MSEDAKKPAEEEVKTDQEMLSEHAQMLEYVTKRIEEAAKAAELMGFGILASRLHSDTSRLYRLCIEAAKAAGVEEHVTIEAPGGPTTDLSVGQEVPVIPNTVQAALDAVNGPAEEPKELDIDAEEFLNRLANKGEG